MKSTEAAEVRILRMELLEAHRELNRLRSQTEQLMSSNRDLSTLLTSATQRSGDLVKIIVAFRRLLEASGSSNALRSVEEILINIIGTEDFAVLMICETPAMRVVAGIGGTLIAMKERPPAFDDLYNQPAKVVPLHIAEHVVGALVIGELLPHRDPLNAADDQVLTLLSRFAATAIVAADQRKTWTVVRLPEVA
jgi:hypothetical protein